MNLTDELDHLRQKLGFDLLLLGKVVLTTARGRGEVT